MSLQKTSFFGPDGLLPLIIIPGRNIALRVPRPERRSQGTEHGGYPRRDGDSLFCLLQEAEFFNKLIDIGVVVPGVDLPAQFTFKCAPCLLCRIKDNTGSQLDGLGVFPVAAAYGLRSDDKGGIPDQLFKPFIFHICLLPASQPCSFGSITSIITSIVVFIFLFSFAFKSAHRKWIKMKDSSLTALNKSRIRNPFHF